MISKLIWLTVTALIVGIAASVMETAGAYPIDPEQSYAILADPLYGTPSLSPTSAYSSIQLWLVDTQGNPMEGVPLALFFTGAVGADPCFCVESFMTETDVFGYALIPLTYGGYLYDAKLAAGLYAYWEQQSVGLYHWEKYKSPDWAPTADCFVELADFITIGAHYGIYYDPHDYNENSIVDISDFILFGAAYGDRCTEVEP